MRSALVAVVCVCGFLLGTAQSRPNVILSYDNESEYSNPPQSLPRQAPQVGWEGAEQNEYEESPILSEEKNWPTVESNAYAPWEIIAQRLGKLRTRRSSANERESSVGRPFSRSGGTGGGGDRPMLSILNPLDVLRQRLLLEMARRRSTNQINQNKQLMQNVGRRRRSISIEGRRSNADGSLKRRENNSSHRSGPATNVVRSSPGFQVKPTQIPIEQ